MLSGTVVRVRDGSAEVALGESDDRAVMEMEDGPVEPGCPISFAVRGERVAVDEEASGKDNVLTGTLDDVRFYGSTTELEVRLGGGQVLRVRQGGRLNSGDHSIGGTVRLGWNADDAVPVSRDDVQ